MGRFTKHIGDGVQYQTGRYVVTCYPKNFNLSDIDKMAVRLCELEDKLESGELIYVKQDKGFTESFTQKTEKPTK